MSPTKLAHAQPSEGVKKSTPSRDRRMVEKDRSKTRTLTKEDYEEIPKKEENASPKLFRRTTAVDESGAQSDGEKDSKQTGRSKIAVPSVKSKLPSTKSKTLWIFAACIVHLPQSQPKSKVIGTYQFPL